MGPRRVLHGAFAVLGARGDHSTRALFLPCLLGIGVGAAELSHCECFSSGAKANAESSTTPRQPLNAFDRALATGRNHIGELGSAATPRARTLGACFLVGSIALAGGLVLAWAAGMLPSVNLFLPGAGWLSKPGKPGMAQSACG